MSSEEKDMDLPIASVWHKKQDSITVILGEADNQYDYKVQTLNQEVQMVSNVDEEEIGDGTELVRKSDAEEAIAKERSRSYDEGFFEGRQSREEEIVNKIEGMNQDVSGTRLHSADVKEALTNLQDELEEEVDQ